MKNIILGWVALSLTAGCDFPNVIYSLYFEKPIVLIAPNYKLEIGKGSVAYVYGNDYCSIKKPNENQRDCINLSGDHVSVNIIQDRKLWSEIWLVNNDNGRIILTRPNGYIVRQTTTN